MASKPATKLALAAGTALASGIAYFKLRRQANQQPSSIPPESNQLTDKQRHYTALSDDEWRHRLTPDSYAILRRHATEPAYSGPFHRKDPNAAPDTLYLCTGCKSPLFIEDAKYNSFSGWPSFTRAIDGTVLEKTERSILGTRVEVSCATCAGHLGHVFEDGPVERGGRRFCVNGHALDKVRGTNLGVGGSEGPEGANQ